MVRPRSSKTSNNSANIGFQAKLWLAADSRSEAETPEGNRSGNMYATTRRLAMMNLAIRGIEADLGEEQADTFRPSYSMVRSFFSWNKRMPQAQFTRGDRRHCGRVRRSVWHALSGEFKSLISDL
jgi:hypothetical protein